MFRLSSVTRRLAAALMLGSLLVPVCVSAQEVPSYARPVAASNDEVVHGRIASVDGAFKISVADDRGFIDNVELHDGTIINPTGLALSQGMSVTIAGFNAGAVFDANEIDTPYSYSGPLPAPVYYGDGYWCPGFAYGYGPAFSLAIVFGLGGYHYEHRHFHGRPWEGHRHVGFYGDRSYVGRRFSDARRASTAEPHSAYSHAPSGFAGRSFAGAPHARRAIAGAPNAGRRSFAAAPYAGRGIAGAPYGGRTFAGTPNAGRRSFAGAPYAGRSAGAQYAGVRYPTGGPRVRVDGGFAASGYLRGAPAPNGFARGGPVGGGFSRAAAPSAGFSRGGGFARGGGGLARGGGLGRGGGAGRR